MRKLWRTQDALMIVFASGPIGLEEIQGSPFRAHADDGDSHARPTNPISALPCAVAARCLGVLRVRNLRSERNRIA